MSQSGEQNLFFLNLPDLQRLCFVSLSLLSGHDDGELRNTQVKTCRELLFLYPDILASPALESFGEITVIMAITFFKTGIIQAYTQRHGQQMGVPQRVLPSTLQVCLSYTLTAKLAPNWNKVGQFLVAGMDFLSDSGKLNAIAMQLNVSEGQQCLSVEANTVRLPPATLEDFDIAPNVVRNFLSCRDAVIRAFSLPSNWCYILPSMKRGQIISISRKMPAECPFQSYADIQKHWSSMYGYRLPPVDEQDVVYCSVYFKLVGERLFTYPLCCIRAEPIQRFPRVDLQGALSSFLFDLRGKLQSICGFPVRMTNKPCYYTTSLTTPGSQSSSTGPVNLTTKAICRPVLTQLPCSFPQNAAFAALEQCPSQLAGPSSNTQYGRGEDLAHATGAAPGATLANPTPRSRPSPMSTSSTPAHAHRIVPIFRNKSLLQHVNITKILAERRQGKREEDRRAPAGPNRVTLGPAPSSQQRPETHPGAGQSRPAPTPQPRPAPHPRVENPRQQKERNSESAGKDHNLSGTLPQFPAINAVISAHISSSKGSSSTGPVNLTTKAICRPVLTQLPCSFPQNAAFAALEQCPSQLAGPSINTQYGRGEDLAHATGAAPGATLANPTPRSRPSPMSTSSTPAHAHRIVPIFRNKALPQHVNITKILAERRQGKREEDRRAPAGPNRVTLGPAPSSQQRPETHPGAGQSRPAPTPQPRPAPHPRVENPRQEKERNSERAGKDHKLNGTLPQFPAINAVIPAHISSSKGGDWFQSKPKKPKVNIVDVEQYARSNQLSKVNAASLQAWLRGRGIPIRSRDKKEELVAKVMSCLNEQ